MSPKKSDATPPLEMVSPIRLGWLLVVNSIRGGVMLCVCKSDGNWPSLDYDGIAKKMWNDSQQEMALWSGELHYLGSVGEANAFVRMESTERDLVRRGAPGKSRLWTRNCHSM